MKKVKKLTQFWNCKSDYNLHAGFFKDTLESYATDSNAHNVNVQFSMFSCIFSYPLTKKF